MQPTVSPEEHDDSDVQGNDQLQGNTPLEEEGRRTAAHDQDQARFRDEAQRGLDDLPVAAANRSNQINDQPGGPSGDQAASKRADKATDSSGPSGGHGQGAGNPLSALTKGGMSRQLKKRLAIGVVSAVLSMIVAVVGFLGFLAEKLIHFEENVVQKIDQRITDTVDKRALTGWAKAASDGGKETAAEKGHPIADAYGNIDTKALETNLNVKIETNPDGSWRDFKAADGSKSSADSASLSDTSSPAEQKLSSRFPAIDFYRESIRSRVIDSNFGILRKFLPSRDESIPKEDAAATKKSMDQKLTARINGTDGSATTDSQVKQEEQAAQSEINNEKSAADTGKSDGGGVGATIMVCTAQQVISTISKYAPLIREATLMRYSVTVLATAHQLKRGDLHPSQLSAFMGLLSGFEQSGGWQRLTGSNKSATISHLDDLSLNPAKGNTTSKVINGINSVTSSIPGFSSFCDIVTSKIVLGLSILAAALELATAPLEKIALTVAQFAGFTVAVDELTKIGTNLASNSFISPSMPSTKVADATIAGYNSYSNVNARSNGGARLTPKQVGVLNAEAEQANYQQAMKRSLAYRVFDPNNANSLTSRLIDSTPSNPAQLATLLNSRLTAMFNPFSHSQVLAVQNFLSPPAYAYTPASDQEDPTGFGVPQYGFTNALRQQYPDPQVNEDWVINYLTQKGQSLYDSGSPSSAELTDQNKDHSDDYHTFVKECLTSTSPNSSNSVPTLPGGSDEGYLNDPVCQSDNHGPQNAYDHFRVYRLDLGIANMITSYNNNKDDQHMAGSVNNGPGGPIAGCTNPFPGGWTPGRLDMGYDGTFKGQIVAPCSGTITYAATSFSNWGGYIEIKFDQQPSGLPQSTLYFSEGVAPTSPSETGQHVNAGQPIANAYTTGAQAGIPGNIEWGVAQDGTSVTDPYAKSLGLGSSAARQMVLSFVTWAQALGVTGAPTSTSSAGAP